MLTRPKYLSSTETFIEEGFKEDLLWEAYMFKEEQKRYGLTKCNFSNNKGTRVSTNILLSTF